MSGHATKDDMAKLGAAIDSLADATRKAGEEQTALLREFVEAMRRGSGAVQTVSLPQPPVPQRAERLVSALVVLVLILSAACVTSVGTNLQQGQRITDLRADIHAERASRERLQVWIDGESKAVRSYIVNGRLKPAAPMPVTQSEPSP